LIDILLRVVDPKAIILSTPTFGMYSFLGKISKSECIDVPLNERFELNVDGIIQKASSSPVQIIFVCSPNNPTGNSVSLKDVERLLNETSSWVVVDEGIYNYLIIYLFILIIIYFIKTK